MTSKPRVASLGMLGVLAAALLLGACTDEKIVEVERPPFNPPPDAATGFLGYYTAATQTTTCGNCHVGTNAQWRDGSAHAGAWEALTRVGQDANASCLGCHGVSERGNAVTAAAGINLVADAAYHDVQCENCHGPGIDHVSLPDNAAEHPLARFDVRNDDGSLDTDASCASCHGDAHGARSLAGDWLISGHAAVNASPASNPSCASCHEGRAAMLKFSGDASNYIEKDFNTGFFQYMPITCTTCHDPHGSPNTAMLRAPINVPDVSANLCMSCHNRATQPALTHSNGDRGAHASQGPIVLGQGAGYYPAGFAFDTTAAYTTHASGRNPELCAGCHVYAFSSTDVNGVEVDYSGHEFLSIPCVDAAGAIVDDQSCGYQLGDRSFASCVDAGCHASQDVAHTFFTATRAEVQVLLNQIWVNNGDPMGSARPVVDAGDTGLLREIFVAFPGEFDKTDGRLSPAEGALFNAQMLGEDLYDHNDGSKGTHNGPFYKALLAATLAELQAEYPGLITVSPSARDIMEKALTQPGVRYTAPARRVATK